MSQLLLKRIRRLSELIVQVVDYYDLMSIQPSSMYGLPRPDRPNAPLRYSPNWTTA